MTFLNGNANKNMPGKEKSGGGLSSMVFNNRLNFMNVTSYIETFPIWDVTALLNDADRPRKPPASYTPRGGFRRAADGVTVCKEKSNFVD